MNCFMCKGNLEDKETTFFAEVESSIVIVKKVPSSVCSQCGDTSYSNEVAKKLEEIVSSNIKNKTEIVVVYFSH